MVVRLSTISSKTGKKCLFWVFRPFLSLCRTASWPYRLSHINALHINQFYWPKNQSMKFSQKNIENWRSWKTQFFWVGDFFFFSKYFFPNTYFFFASSPWKLVTNYVLEWMGLNFYYYDGLQPKISAGIINEHECMLL